MSRSMFRLLAAAMFMLAFVPDVSHAQFMSARRLAMGGAPVPGCGPGADGVNVAYRAVPRPPHGCRSLSLPIGLLPLIATPPVLNPDNPDFNAFKLANLLMNAPWNYTLRAPLAPSNDIGVTIGRNSLAVDLGDVGHLLPRETSEYAMVARLPILAVGIGRAFVGVSPLVHAENALSLNAPLQSALIDGQAFQPLTQYRLTDAALGQAAVQGMVGWAQPLWNPSHDFPNSRAGLYGGVRARLIRGLAFADADNVAGFTTPDTLFGNDAVDIAYSSHLRTATPGGGGFGQGFDAGVVLVAGRSEIGLAVNDLATRINWKVRERLIQEDSLTGDVLETTISDGQAWTSTIPATGNLTATTQVGRFLLAAAATRDALGRTTSCAGVERWLGRFALRAGLARDLQHQTQTSGGIGVRFGRFGIDTGVATHSRNLTHERSTELGAGFAFFH